MQATERGQSTSTFTRSKPATSVDHDYVDWVATGLCFLFPAVSAMLSGMHCVHYGLAALQLNHDNVKDLECPSGFPPSSYDSTRPLGIVQSRC